MDSEYDPPRLFHRQPQDDDRFEAVRAAFRDAGSSYLRSPWPWLCWGLLLPTAALATTRAAGAWGPVGVLLLWSLTIIAGGVVEATSLARHRAGGSAIAGWALRVQGNLSLIAVVLSALLLYLDSSWALPGLWLLLLGHSFYGLGGLSFPALRRYGLTYQLGGLVALCAGTAALVVFAATAAAANLGMALAVWRRRGGVGEP